jgi:hypothetical protein
MNPEISWRHQRENIDHLLARLTTDPGFMHLISRDHVSALVDYSDAGLERHAARPNAARSRRVALPARRVARARAA